MRKGKEDPEPDPYVWLMDQDPGGPKTCRSGSRAGSVPLTNGSGSGRPKHADPDPDPQHWLDGKQMSSQVFVLLSLQFPKPNIFTFFARSHSFSAACLPNSAKSTETFSDKNCISRETVFLRKSMKSEHRTITRTIKNTGFDHQIANKPDTDL